MTRTTFSPFAQALVWPLNTALAPSLVSLAVGFFALRTTTNPASAPSVHSARRHEHSAARRRTVVELDMARSSERERGLDQRVAVAVGEVHATLGLERDARARGIFHPCR